MHANPFSTRFIQPGAIDYQRFDGGTVRELAESFLKLLSKKGSIIGPHGSGKSTLIANLVSEFESLRPETRIHSLRFSTEMSSMAALSASMSQWSTASIVILDGYEQVGAWSRFWINRIAKSLGIHLLVTAHLRIRGFETVWETSVTEASSCWVVQQLLLQSGPSDLVKELLASDAWKRSRERHQQNIRESLFDMYDWYRDRSPSDEHC